MEDPSSDQWAEEEAHLHLADEVDPKAISNDKEEAVVGVDLSSNALRNNSKEDHETLLQATGEISVPHNNSRDLRNSSNKVTVVVAADLSKGLRSKAAATGAVVAAPLSKTSIAAEEDQDKIHRDLSNSISRKVVAIKIGSSKEVAIRIVSSKEVATRNKEAVIRSKEEAIKIGAGSRVVDRRIAGTAVDMVLETMVEWIKKIGIRKALAIR